MKKYFVFIILFIFSARTVNASVLSNQLVGRILLQVESKGEAWYISPSNYMRYYMGRPADAFQLMRQFGRGISNSNLQKIPLGLSSINGNDSDADNLSDDLEKALGTDPGKKDSDGDGFDDYSELKNNYNPLGTGFLKTDIAYGNYQGGQIFLQVEAHGEAWYINPVDGKRYFLGRPADAFSLMRSFGLGITNANLAKIPSDSADYSSSDLELKIFAAVNQERINNGLKALVWNSDLAKVAREHSQNLATEDSAFTGDGKTCDFPIIHHEGLDFGDYSSDRLNNRNISYFSAAAENIALMPMVETTVTFREGDPAEELLDSCATRRSVMDKNFKSSLDAETDISQKKEIIKKELNTRTQSYAAEKFVQIDSQNWRSIEEVSAETVNGWMNSPGHRANILTSEFDEAGMGVATVGSYVIATQVFIKRLSCGYQDAACCQEDSNTFYCYLPSTCQSGYCR